MEAVIIVLLPLRRSTERPEAALGGPASAGRTRRRNVKEGGGDERELRDPQPSRRSSVIDGAAERSGSRASSSPSSPRHTWIQGVYRKVDGEYGRLAEPCQSERFFT
jgi:hypothetical protein